MAEWMYLGPTTMVLLAAGLTGAVMGEAWVLADEASFREEVKQHLQGGGVGATSVHRRARKWPGQNSTLQYSITTGYWVEC